VSRATLVAVGVREGAGDVPALDVVERLGQRRARRGDSLPQQRLVEPGGVQCQHRELEPGVSQGPGRIRGVAAGNGQVPATAEGGDQFVAPDGVRVEDEDV